MVVEQAQEGADFKMLFFNSDGSLGAVSYTHLIHGIHKKTLMWYDQVGLLSPAFVGENGYRYYSYRQSARLETILMLRALEVSLSLIHISMVLIRFIRSLLSGRNLGSVLLGRSLLYHGPRHFSTVNPPSSRKTEDAPGGTSSVSRFKGSCRLSPGCRCRPWRL